ncbi:MAG: quinol:cytochrome C oxidoreductase [Flavobacteriaceae bacterium]|nr:MAG: quinol:cytochrome C oxidoreductase [Flavobacteriaceae bacterium]
MTQRKNFKFKPLFIGAFLLILSTFGLQAQTGDGAKGFELFKANCTACHGLDDKLVGPALRDVGKRQERDWLQKWIKDNKALRESGDAYANKIFNEYNKTEMLQFPNFSEQDIDDIIAYLGDAEASEAAAKKAEEDAKAASNPANAQEGGAASNDVSKVLVAGFAILIGLLTWLLLKLNQLVNLSKPEELLELEKLTGGNKTLAEIIQPALKFLLPFLLVIGLFGAWKFMLHLGVDKGYQPEQPIYFSHKIHAGENKIDCQYCHSSAKYGKVSGIPSTNVCMNCHKVIKEYTGDYLPEGKTKEDLTKEIQKLYDAAGWDGTKYTGVTKPLKWVRIHNMQDFVFFNHSQHVIAGEKAIKKAKEASGEIGPGDPVCFACHGKVNEMDEVKMHNDFTMGFCINCHRETEIDMENKYNAATFDKLHEKVKVQHGKDAKLNVSAMGGMECAKCHY